MKPWNGWPSPIVQNAAGIDEYVAVIADFNVCLEILDLDIVSTFLMVPVSPSNLVLSLDESFQCMSVRKSVKIVEDLFASGINTRPIEFWLERPSVVMCRDIASTSAV